MKILKKMVSVTLILLLVAPYLTTIALYADDLGTASFSAKFTETDSDTITDFKADDTDGNVEVSYDARMTEHDKEIKVTLPAGLEFDSLPSADGVDVTNVRTEEDGSNSILYATIPANDMYIYKFISFGVDLDTDVFYSGQSFVIECEYYELDDNGDQDASLPSQSVNLNLTAYDYAENGTVKSWVVHDTDKIFADSKNTFTLITQFNNDYSLLNGALRNDDFTINIQNYQIDMSKILVNQGSGYQELGSNYQYIDIEDTENYTYDSSTGILTFADFDLNPAQTVKRLEIDFEVNFNSEFFNEDDTIKWNNVDSSSATYIENGVNNVGSSVHEGGNSHEMIFGSNDYFVDIQIWAQNNDTNIKYVSDESEKLENTLKPDVETPLFKTYIDNYNHDIENLEYTIIIPNGMTVTSVSAPQVSDKSANYGGTITFTDSNNNVTTANQGETLDLVEPVTGNDTITVTVNSMNALDVIDYELYSNNRTKFGIGFYGTVTGEEGTAFDISYDDLSVTADVDGKVDEPFSDPDGSNNSKELTIKNLQKTSVNSKIYEFRTDGQLTEGVYPSDSVEITTEYEIADTNDLSTYKKVQDPVIYLNIPEEFTAPGGSFGKEDITLTENGTDITDSISSFKVLDSAILDNGTMLEIKLEGYTLEYPDVLTLKTDTVVDPNLTGGCTIVLPDGASSFGTTNTSELAGVYPTAEVKVAQSTLGDEVDVTGDYLVGTEAGGQITINIPQTLRAISSVDTNDNGFVSVNPMTDLSDYPQYYMGEEGVFNFSLQNTTSEDIQNLTGYYVLPDDEYEGMQFVLDDALVEYDTTNYTYAFTNDEIVDTSGWLSGDDTNVTWSTTFPSDGEITAIKIVAKELDAGETYFIEYPYTTKYLTEEQYDQSRYDKKTDGELLYMHNNSNSSEGNKASVTIVESEYPEIDTNIDSTYGNDDVNELITDVQDYTVTDDYSELANDINKDETTISLTSPDESTYSYTYNEFINLSTIPVGDYTIHYKTLNDADGHVTTKDIDFKVEQSTSIVKSVSDQNNNGIAEENETLTYTLTLSNTTSSKLTDVAVRDSMLEKLPDYITYNNDLSLNKGAYSGDILDGTLTIDSIDPYDSIEITYTITLDEIPDNITELENIVTSDGTKPSTTCEEGVDKECSIAVIPTNPETIITKSVSDENSNALAEVGETLTYSIDITNTSSDEYAVKVDVRDSMLENITNYLTYNNDLHLDSGTYIGDITKGTLTVNKIAPGDTISITYSVTVLEAPSDIDSILNIATTDGSSPTDNCLPTDTTCSSVEIDLTTEESGEISTGSPTGENGESYGISKTGLTYSITAIISIVLILIAIVFIKKAKK